MLASLVRKDYGFEPYEKETRDMQIKITVEVCPEEDVPSNIGAVGIVNPQDGAYFRFSYLIYDALQHIAGEEGVKLADYESVSILFPQSNEAIVVIQPGQVFEQNRPGG